MEKEKQMMNDKKMNRKMNGKKSLKGSMKKAGCLTMAAVLAVSISKPSFSISAGDHPDRDQCGCTVPGG